MITSLCLMDTQSEERKKNNSLNNIRVSNLRNNLNRRIIDIKHFLKAASYIIVGNSGLGRPTEEEFVEIEVLVDNDLQDPQQLLDVKDIDKPQIISLNGDDANVPKDDELPNIIHDALPNVPDNELPYFINDEVPNEPDN